VRTSLYPSAFRAFNIFVETSDSKHLRTTVYGNSAGLFKTDGPGQGHIPRNMRLALLMLDVVQPYVQVMEVKLVTPKINKDGVATSVFSLHEVDPETGDLPGVSNGEMPVPPFFCNRPFLHINPSFFYTFKLQRSFRLMKEGSISILPTKWGEE